MKQNTKLTFKFFLHRVKRYKWLAIALILGLTISTIAYMSWAIVVRDFFNALTLEIARAAIVEKLLFLLLIIILIEIIEWIGHRTAAFINDYFQPKVMADIVDDCFQHMQKHSYSFFTNNFVGSLVKKVTRMARAFEGIADRVTWDLIPLALKLIIIIGVLSWIHPLLGIAILVWTVLFAGLNYLLSLYKLPFDIAKADSDTRVTGSLADTITNSINIKLFANLSYEIRKFARVTEDWRKKTKKSWNIGTIIEGGQAILMIVLEIAVLYIAIKLWEKKLIGIGDFFIIQAYLFELFDQIWDFGRIIRDLYEKLADAEEMTEILNTPFEIKDKPNAKPITINHGQVEFKNVKFSYIDGENVINELSFKVKPGEKIALIGPSGGGKSTTVKLLLRLFDIDKGKILIDNQNIAHHTQDSLRKQIALVPQDPILFHRTLMDNIRYGRRNASNKEVIAAAKMAHCHEFIINFKDGYKTFVGERGVKLSGGQRQRVAIARAILSNAKILVLDEATSSLDSESENLIQDALEKLIKNKTTFIIAHRLSTIMKVDRIFVLDKGRIVEEGAHSDLVGKKSGLYAKLWDMQVGGYL